jgi:hypothetical protein
VEHRRLGLPAGLGQQTSAELRDDRPAASAEAGAPPDLWEESADHAALAPTPDVSVGR